MIEVARYIDKFYSENLTVKKSGQRMQPFVFITLSALFRRCITARLISIWPACVLKMPSGCFSPPTSMWRKSEIWWASAADPILPDPLKRNLVIHRPPIANTGPIPYQISVPTHRRKQADTGFHRSSDLFLFYLIFCQIQDCSSKNCGCPDALLSFPALLRNAGNERSPWLLKTSAAPSLPDL